MKNSIKPLTRDKSGLPDMEWKILKKLNTPKKIQDYLDGLHFNLEKKRETYMSVAKTMKRGKAHCFEGALVAAAALWAHGEKPLLMDLRTSAKDVDHVVALFRRHGAWGAISKTNHGVLRYREPIYKNLRELALSYFHEYFLPSGKKTLRKYSKPFDLSRTKIDWLTSKDDLEKLVKQVDSSPHLNLLSKDQVKNLRKADKIEVKMGKIVEYK